MNRIDVTLGYLGKTCYPRFYIEPVLIARDFFEKCLYERRLFRPWPDQSHFTNEDVEQLGQFVDPTLAQEVPAQQDPIVPIGTESSMASMVMAHGANLVNPIWLAI